MSDDVPVARPKKPLPSVPGIELTVSASSPSVSPRGDLPAMRMSGHTDVGSSDDEEDRSGDVSGDEKHASAAGASTSPRSNTISSPRGLGSSSDQIRPRGATGVRTFFFFLVSRFGVGSLGWLLSHSCRLGWVLCSGRPATALS